MLKSYMDGEVYEAKPFKGKIVEKACSMRFLSSANISQSYFWQHKR